MEQPFSAIDLSPNLERVEAHWRSLIRGANDMPFWDDFVPSSLADLADDALLLDVFAKPMRFRFDSVVGGEIERRYGRPVSNCFSDDLEPSLPFDYLNAQAVATVETRKPTLHTAVSYSRLLLPMWGDGRVSMLLGAFDWL